MGWKGITAAGITVLVMFGSGVFMSGAQASGCGGGQVDATTATSSQPIAGYSGDQLANAAAIMNAATWLGLDGQAQVIGVMTAMGESGLRVLDHGDQAGPDSRGLFQQRDSWGSLADRMDPTKSAVLFFQRLMQVPGWQAMTPTMAAHTVQVNADPNHYTRFYPAAAQVVQALTSNGGGTPGCGCVTPPSRLTPTHAIAGSPICGPESTPSASRRCTRPPCGTTCSGRRMPWSTPSSRPASAPMRAGVRPQGCR